MAESVVSLWRQTPNTNYMREDGRDRHPSHAWVTERLTALYGSSLFSLLDCGVMSGVTYSALQAAGLRTDYTGIDIGRQVVQACQEEFPEARWRQMSITDLAFSGNSFDVVNCRHVLECLPYYETALRELFRVARQHVVLCFWQPPRAPETLLRRETADGYIWLNRYAPEPLERLLSTLASTVERADVTAGPDSNRIYFCAK